MAEPAWMEGVHERDALFGFPPTKLEDTVNWAGTAMACANGDLLSHAIYSVPGFLTARIHEYAERDGWRCIDGRWLCPACVATAMGGGS